MDNMMKLFEFRLDTLHKKFTLL